MSGGTLILLRILDRLEEILIATLMALATVIIFIAVVHRYLLGVPFLFPILFPINLSWAQELCIYMFVWVAKFGPIGVKEFEVFDLPYILPDLKTLRKVTDGPLGARLLKLLDSKGMTGLAYWDNGFKQMSANRKLVTPADYKGLKFRIQSSKVLEAQFRSLGVIPQVMAFSEVYQALQTGVVDGQENTWSNIYTQKMHEVQKYITETNHGYIGYVVVTNKKFWDGLPADVRAQCEKAMKEATEYGNGQSAKENDDALAEIKKTGKSEIIKLTPEQDAAMRKAVEPVYKDVASRVGQPLIDEFLKETRGATN